MKRRTREAWSPFRPMPGRVDKATKSPNMRRRGRGGLVIEGRSETYHRLNTE